MAEKTSPSLAGEKKEEEKKESEKVELQRVLGLASVISLIVGNIIGAGIFVNPTTIGRQLQSVGAVLIMWLVTGLYNILLSSPASKATMGMVSAQYLMAAMLGDDCPEPWLLKSLLAVVLIVVAMMLNMYSSKMATRVIGACTLGKVTGLIIIIIAGIYYMAIGNTQNFENGFAGTATDPANYAIAFYNGLGAYAGVEHVARITEEIKNPRRNLPLAIILGVPVVIIFYLLTNMAYFAALDMDEFFNADSVAYATAEKIVPGYGWVMSIAVAISTFGTCSALALSQPKNLFAASRQGQLPLVFSMIHVDWKTPFPLLIYQMVVMITLVFLTDIWTLISATSFLSSFFYGLTALSLVVLRIRYPKWERPFKIPLVIPIIVTIVSAAMLVISITTGKNKMMFLYAFLATLAGIPVHFLFVWWNFKIPGWDYVTAWTQVLTKAMPGEDEFSQQYLQDSKEQNSNVRKRESAAKAPNFEHTSL